MFPISDERVNFMNNGGFIMLPRSFMYWRWYRNANTMRVFLHLVMSANYTEHGFEGITVRRGQVVTSHPSLASKLKLSEQQVRTALKHLKSTGDISVRVTSKFSIITIHSFDSFQPAAGRSTDKQRTDTGQRTDVQQQYNKGIKEKGNNSFLPQNLCEDTEASLKKRCEKKDYISEELCEKTKPLSDDLCDRTEPLYDDLRDRTKPLSEHLTEQTLPLSKTAGGEERPDLWAASRKLIGGES